MSDERQYSDLRWKHTKSGRRTVIQSSVMGDVCDATRVQTWLMDTIRADAVRASMGLSEPYDAYDTDQFHRTQGQVSVRNAEGDEHLFVVEIRNITPEHFTEITGAPVRDDLQTTKPQAKESWAETVTTGTAKRPPCQGF